MGKRKNSEHESLVLDTIAGIAAQRIVLYGPRVAVVRDPADEVSKGGIILPDQAQRKDPVGTVVLVGLGVDTNSEDTVVSGLRVGDRVMYTKYNPQLFRITLPDGRDVNIEVMHVTDLYIGWRTNA